MKLQRSYFDPGVSFVNRTLVCTWHEVCCVMTFLFEEGMLVKIHLLMKDLIFKAQLPILF